MQGVSCGYTALERLFMLCIYISISVLCIMRLCNQSGYGCLLLLVEWIKLYWTSIDILGLANTVQSEVYADIKIFYSKYLTVLCTETYWLDLLSGKLMSIFCYFQFWFLFLQSQNLIHCFFFSFFFHILFFVICSNCKD